VVVNNSPIFQQNGPVTLTSNYWTYWCR